MLVELYFDGACHNRKDEMTPMGIGVAVFIDGEYNDALSIARFVGYGTSNISEWKGCNAAAVLASKLIQLYSLDVAGSDKVKIYSDSQLITYQFNGKYKINDPNFIPYKIQAKEKLKSVGLEALEIIWIRRELNTHADKLSKQGLAKKPK